MDAISDFMVTVMPLLLIAGLVAQWQALRRFPGGWRLAAWVPALALGAAIAIAALGIMAGSNLAPIWVVLALPPCLLWLAGLWLLRGLWAWGAR
jgi:hypothetical protein